MLQAHTQICVLSYLVVCFCVCSNSCLEAKGVFFRPGNLVSCSVSSSNRSLGGPVGFYFGMERVSVVTEMVALCSYY